MKGLFLGNGAVGVPSLEAYLDSLGPDNVEVITKSSQKPGLIERFASENGAKVRPVQMTKEGLLQAVGDINFDVALIVSFGVILPKDLLAEHSGKFFNMHFSLLPDYRGPAPVQRGILAGDTEFGVTLQEVVPAVDAGRIVMQQQVDFEKDEMASQIFAELSALAGEMVPEFLERFRNNALALTDQRGEVTKAPKIEKEECIVTAEMSAEDVWRKYRAFDHGSGVYVKGAIHKKGKSDQSVRVKIIAMSKERQNNEDFHFSFPDGDLYMQEVHISGKTPTSVPDIRRGYTGKNGRPLLTLEGFGASDYSDA